ncbi:hypothetical protein Mal35_39430 [Gimesia maris]|nr:hypothetical protein Mal35_39430 [Gimesia maris]
MLIAFESLTIRSACLTQRTPRVLADERLHYNSSPIDQKTPGVACFRLVTWNYP